MIFYFRQFMVGLGIRELILTAIVMAVVWYGFKKVAREKTAKKPGGGETVARDFNPGAVEMQACPVCGVYVATGSSDCGTAGCPYPEK